ncbi:hypothetical protein H8E52_12905 [bacterium]|nr:hypothetical protein [bacterium]
MNRFLSTCLLAVTAALVLLPGCAMRERRLDDTMPVPVLAVMPLANYTESSEALGRVMPALCEELAMRGIPAISDRDMRPILRRHRIRGGGIITPEDIQAIRSATQASAILFGSVDFYAEGTNPELGLSLRVVDIASLEVLYAGSASVTGADFAGWFGIGRKDSLSALMEPALHEVLQSFDIVRLSEALAGENLPQGSALALVPFENRSDYPFAGSIFSAVLNAELFRRGYRLMDPALLGEVYMQERRAPRGEVDLVLVDSMHTALGVQWVLTGGVEQFSPSTGDPLSAPELEIHGRMLKASEGRLVFNFESELMGSPAGQVFGFEERRSLGRLAQKAAMRLVTQMNYSIEEEFEKKQ